MEPTDPLSQHLALLRIRRRASRRNGWFLLVLMLGTAALGFFYLREQYQVDWDALQFPFMFIVLSIVLLAHAANESMLRLVIELIEAMQRSHMEP